MTISATNSPRILFVVTEDQYFWMHRLVLARAVRDAVCEVVVATLPVRCAKLRSGSAMGNLHLLPP
jgi:hypothetical protein